MRIELDEKELRERINLNRNRLLNDSYYTIDGIFSPSDYEWYGDKEGRALLAFVSHYKNLLWSEDSEGVSKNENGVYMSGDIIYAEISGGGERYAEKIVSVDGHALSPLLKYYKLPKEIILSTKQKILF